jgi:hypothetical protein
MMREAAGNAASHDRQPFEGSSPQVVQPVPTVLTRDRIFSECGGFFDSVESESIGSGCIGSTLWSSEE